MSQQQRTKFPSNLYSTKTPGCRKELKFLCLDFLLQVHRGEGGVISILWSAQYRIGMIWKNGGKLKFLEWKIHYFFPQDSLNFNMNFKVSCPKAPINFHVWSLSGIAAKSGRHNQARGVHNILLVRVCAAHMGGFWPLNYLNKGIISSNFPYRWVGHRINSYIRW